MMLIPLQQNIDCALREHTRCIHTVPAHLVGRRASAFHPLGTAGARAREHHAAHHPAQCCRGHGRNPAARCSATQVYQEGRCAHQGGTHQGGTHQGATQQGSGYGTC
eukprot:scaffold72858_cov55-Phaeocystis_antarctica.AAC.1